MKSVVVKWLITLISCNYLNKIVGQINNNDEDILTTKLKQLSLGNGNFIPPLPISIRDALNTQKRLSNTYGPPVLEEVITQNEKTPKPFPTLLPVSLLKQIMSNKESFQNPKSVENSKLNNFPLYTTFTVPENKKNEKSDGMLIFQESINNLDDNVRDLVLQNFNNKNDDNDDDDDDNGMESNSEEESNEQSPNKPNVLIIQNEKSGFIRSSSSTDSTYQPTFGNSYENNNQSETGPIIKQYVIIIKPKNVNFLNKLV